jgi:hypothetical protein
MSGAAGIPAVHGGEEVKRCVRFVRRGLPSTVLAGQVGCRVRPVILRSVWLRPVE